MSTGPIAERHRLPVGLRLLVVGAVVALVAAVGLAVSHYLGTRPVAASPAGVPLTGPGRLADLAAPAGQPGPGGDPNRRTLVLYNGGGPAPNLGHQYAVQAANLASRGGAWTMRPVDRYSDGELASYQAVICLGVDDRPIPAALLSEVAHSRTPVLWFGLGIRQLFGHDPSLAQRMGWSADENGVGDVTGVEYHGQVLKRRAEDNDALVRNSVTDARIAQVLGTARRADGSTLPWAVQSGSLTYVGEIPFSYAAPGDRYLAGADLILRTVAPNAPDRHRALIRLEDVGPNTNPGDIVAITGYLAGRGVPFTLAVYPYYRDPHGVANHGRPTEFRLVDKPKVVEALKYAMRHGGTILMHGYTHQYEDQHNPYTGTSGEDFEFYLAHVDPENNVQFDGPVPADSHEWVTSGCPPAGASSSAWDCPTRTCSSFRTTPRR